MNIFAIEGNVNTGEIDWIQSGKSQDNYRVVKMILESCQMLCTALNELSGNQIAPYKSTHKNHPSTKWTKASSANFENLVIHTAAMLEEYTERFGKVHKCTDVLNKCIELYDPSVFPSQASTKLPLAMPVEFKSDNTIESYRKFYASKPRVRYSESKVPDWFKKYRGNKEYQIIHD
tara:strand:- start:88 stop:615 length:528 start_codon:yes stop_codon:yes gene_type:complete